MSASGIAVDDGKVDAIRKMSPPRSLKALRLFLGLASYYRHFVPNFSKVAGPIYVLTRKDASSLWTSG